MRCNKAHDSYMHGTPETQEGPSTEKNLMSDLFIALVFIGIVVAPAAFASRAYGKPTAEQAPSSSLLQDRS
jgi:hypothetical protein